MSQNFTIVTEYGVSRTSTSFYLSVSGAHAILFSLFLRTPDYTTIIARVFIINTIKKKERTNSTRKWLWAVMLPQLVKLPRVKVSWRKEMKAAEARQENVQARRNVRSRKLNWSSLEVRMVRLLKWTRSTGDHKVHWSYKYTGTCVQTYSPPETIYWAEFVVSSEGPSSGSLY